MTPTNNTSTAALWYSPIQKEFLKIQLGDGSNLNGIDCPLLKDGGMQLWFKEEMPAIDSEEMLKMTIRYMALPNFLEAALYMNLTGNLTKDDLRLHSCQHRQADDRKPTF